MSNISNERLEEFIRSPLENSLTRGEQMEMAQRLLAFEKASAQPVVFINGAWTLVYYRPPKEMGLEIGTLLYAAPQLQPVSNPCTLPDKASWKDAPQGSENVDWAQGWNACREAMQTMNRKVS